MSNDYKKLLGDNPPRLHYWGDKPQIGGMCKDYLEIMENYICNSEAEIPKSVIETGAGLSTLWFLELGFRVVSFICDDDVISRTKAFLSENGQSSSRWTPVSGFSEEQLPLYVLTKPDDLFGLALIDGGHSLQNVFVDCVYAHYALAKGGYMVLDDMQLGSVKLMYDVLTNGWQYELQHENSKIAVFKKLTHDRLFPDFGAQKPLLEKLSKVLAI